MCVCVVCCVAEAIVAESCCETIGAIYCQVECLYVVTMAMNIVEYRMLLNMLTANSGMANISKQCHITPHHTLDVMFISPQTSC